MSKAAVAFDRGDSSPRGRRESERGGEGRSLGKDFPKNPPTLPMPGFLPLGPTFYGFQNVPKQRPHPETMFSLEAWRNISSSNNNNEKYK